LATPDFELSLHFQLLSSPIIDAIQRFFPMSGGKQYLGIFEISQLSSLHINCGVIGGGGFALLWGLVHWVEL
jgi:hypothetical protein